MRVATAVAIASAGVLGVRAQTNQSALQPQLLLLANTPATCSWGTGLTCALSDSTNNLKLGAGCVLPVPIPTDNYVADKRTNKFDDALSGTASAQPFVEITSALVGSATTSADTTTGQVGWNYYKTNPLTSQSVINFKVPGLYSLSIIATDYDRSANCDGCVAINDAYRPRFKTGTCPSVPFATTENVMFRSVRDRSLCLDDGGGTLGGQTKFTLTACNPNSPNQVFVNDPIKMQYKNFNKPSLCLDDGGSVRSRPTPAHLWGCDQNNQNQWFTYDPATLLLRQSAKPNLCLTDILQTGTTRWFYLVDCDATNVNQQFERVPQYQLPSPSSLTTTSLAQAKTYEDQFNAFVDGSNVLNNPNSGNDCNDVVSKVEYLRDDLKDFTGSCFDAAALATNVANLKANPFPEHLQSSYSSLQATLVANGQWCCQKSKTLKEKYIEYGCPSAATDKGCVGGTGNSCSMNLCLKVSGDAIATRTIAIDAPVQTASTGVLNALPSRPTGSDASKNVYYSVPCTDFSETDSNCHYNVKLSELLKVTSSFAASFPTPLSEANKINDYVFWRYNIDGGLWQTWDPHSDSPLAFKDASTSVIVEAWTSLGRVGDAFSFDVNLFVHSTLTCASYDSMWALLGSTKVGNAYCAYPGSDFALVKLDMTVADVIPHPTATVTGSYTGVTCEIMLKEESTTATDTTAYQLLSDATSPTITKSFAVEMVHNPHTARKTAASVSCKFTRSPHSNTIMLADDTDTNSITCHHDFTVADCDAPELFSATPAGVCADKCAGNSAPGVNEACGGTVVRSDATVTSISTTDAQCCTDCDPDLVCVAVSQTSVKRCQMPSVTPLMLAATEEGMGFASSETLALLGASAMVAIAALVVVKRRVARPIVDEDAYYPLLE